MTFARVETTTVGPLRRSPLRLALVQARTTPVLALERPEAVEQLVDALHGWTLTDRQSNREVALQVGPGGVRQRAGSVETVWVLASEDETIRAAVSASSVAVESEAYAHWEGFRDAIRLVLSAVELTFAPTRCTRLGVRYVNEIDVGRAESDPDRLAEQLNTGLLAPALALGRPLVSSLAELRVEEEDGGVLALRHGLVDMQTYLLDFDAYREASEPFNAVVLTQRAERFHERIESVFAWSLTEGYLNELRAGGEAA